MSSEEAPLTRLEQLEKVRATKLAEKAKARDAQYEVDLEARIALEDSHDTIAAVEVTRFVHGQPTMALLRTPAAAEYKRYKSQVFANAQKRKGAVSLEEAQEILARACWVYPEGKEAQAAMLDAFPGLLTPLGSAASTLAEGKTEDEGKD